MSADTPWAYPGCRLPTDLSAEWDVRESPRAERRAYRMMARELLLYMTPVQRCLHEMTVCLRTMDKGRYLPELHKWFEATRPALLAYLDERRDEVNAVVASDPHLYGFHIEQRQIEQGC